MRVQNPNRTTSAARSGDACFNKGACGAACASSERALREAVLQTSLDGIAIYNPRGEMVFANAEFAAVSGYANPAELVGRNWKSFYDEWTCEHFRKVIIPRVEADGRWRGEVLARKADGTPYHQEVSLARLEDGGTAQAVRDISERKEVEAELARARDAALEAARVKAEFLANMSHEIRTPMSGVIGMADLLLDSGLAGRQREFAEVLRGSAQTLLHLINDILDFSKIEAGKLRIEAHDFDLLSVIESSVETHAPRAQGKGIELVSFAEEGVPRRVRGDGARLCQVLLNLVANAVKFTERGEVFVRASLAERAGASALLRFEVRDTGVGVAPEAMAKLFRPFSQADGSMTRKYGGTGLGLAISKQLVEMMGGEIGCETKPGRGSTFWFTARLAAPRDARAAEDAAAETSAAARATARVLVVEDNSTHCRVLCRQIESWGWRVGCAHDSAEAFATLQDAAAADEPYDLVLLDSSVAGAREAARTIANGPDFRRTRVALLSDLSTRLPALRSRRGRAPEVLFKPLTQSQLRSRLEATLSGEGAREDAATRRGRTAARREKTSGAKPSCDGAGAARVLVAEDDAVIREVVRQHLARLGHEADFVMNGREAVEAVGRTRYGLVLMDVQMPEIDGYEATAAIRRAERDGRPRTTVVAFTAHALAGDRQKCLDAGMDDYVAKPDVGETLRAVLKRWLAPESRAQENRKSSPPAPVGTSLETFVRPSVLRLMGRDGEAGGVFGAYEKFCADSRAEVESLKTHARRGDAESLRRAAHRLKGRADIYGLERLAGLCAELEQRATTCEPSSSEEGIDAVELELGLLRGAIEYERGGD
ncbi:MAG TPA: response regulator [Pyrinomonadaceae bacterium]